MSEVVLGSTLAGFRVERDDYNIAQEHLADAIEMLVTRARASLSDDRSPKDPYEKGA